MQQSSPVSAPGLVVQAQRKFIGRVLQWGGLLCIMVCVAVGPANAQEGALNLAMTASPDPVSPGGQVTYQITVTNQSTEGATDLYVRSPLPAHTDAGETYTGGECPGSECSAGETIEWRVGTLPAGESTVVSYAPQVRMDNQAPLEGTVLNYSATAEGDTDLSLGIQTASTSASADAVVDSGLLVHTFNVDYK